MIKATNLVKKFDGDFVALDQINCQVPSGCIYGMVGSNGAGKSTFLKVLSGIYRSDGGTITLDDEPVYENPSAKSKMVFIPDELYFLAGANMKRMQQLYKAVYDTFDDERYRLLMNAFQLPEKKSINSFSKGMKRQAATILGLSAKTPYIFFDETFDGLDPVMRNFVKSLICSDVAQRKTTAIITSHSLRELEDTCDQLVLLHKGGVVLESDADDLKTSLFKVQIAFPYEYTGEMFSELQIEQFSKKGSVANLIVRGGREQAEEILKAKGPTLFEILPLTLEEIFTNEMKIRGYDFKNILGGIDDEK